MFHVLSNKSKLNRVVRLKTFPKAMSTLSIVHETIDGSSSTVRQIYFPDDRQLPQKNRTMFTKSQKKELEVHFHMNNCAIPDSATREQLSVKYRKTPKQIRSLFYRIRSEHVQIQQYLDQSSVQKSNVEVEGETQEINKLNRLTSQSQDDLVNSNEPPNERPKECHKKRPNERPNEPPKERPKECHKKRPNERPNEPPKERPKECHKKRPNALPNERPIEHLNKRPNEHPNERCNKRPNERSNKHPNDRPNERPDERSNVNLNVNPNENFYYNQNHYLNHLPNHLHNANPNVHLPVPGSHNPCAQCQTSYHHLPIYSPMPPSPNSYTQFMHTPWPNTHPLMYNWPDTSDLYRRMDHNLHRYVTDLQ